MRALQRISIVVFVILGLVIIARAMVIKIEPGSIGVVNKEWTSGFVEDDFGPGYHFDVGPFHNWTVFDTTVQTLHMKSRIGPGEEGTRPLSVKSFDGATVTMDLSIKYRIKPGEVWKVMKKAGPGQTVASGYKRLAIDRGINVLQKSLGAMSTPEFYNPESRAQVQTLMQRDLLKAFDDLSFELVSILIRDIRFQDAFEEGIKKKALAQEQRNLNRAETLAADFKGRTAKIERETEAKVVVIDEEREKTLITMTAENDRKVAAIRADFEKRVTEIRSDADLYAAVKAAEGVKLVKDAEAKGQTLKRESLVSRGGDVFVALELVKNLQLGDMVVSTQAVNPLDVASILEKLGLPPK